jgi:hypothetical protein
MHDRCALSDDHAQRRRRYALDMIQRPLLGLSMRF